MVNLLWCTGCEDITAVGNALALELMITNYHYEQKWLKNKLGPDDLYFYDAIAPVVDADTLDTSKMYLKDRHGENEDGTVGDYLNVPMNQEQYEKFVEEFRKESTQEKVKEYVLDPMVNYLVKRLRPYIISY